MGKDAKKLEPCALFVGMWKGLAGMENSMEVAPKIENRITIWSSNPISWYRHKIIENRILKRYLHIHIDCSIIYNSQEVEAT